ncbi:MAG: DAK2 domain-containing protein, partial [Clostridia bacterium]
TPARQVFVLPNNTNIILAAQQAAELTEKQVYVLPTKSVPMGIAAAIAFLPDQSGEENMRRMTEAAERVHTASITYAVRDTTFDNRDIHEGDIMGLIDNRISLLGHAVSDVAQEVVEQMVTGDTELISIYYGESVTPEEAEALEVRLCERFPMCDVSLYCGGQPLYYYLIAVE